MNIDFERDDYLPEEKETYRIGEEINEKIKEFLISGMEKGDLRDTLEVTPTIFQFWGMLSGIIQLAAIKEEYIKNDGIIKNAVFRIWFSYALLFYCKQRGIKSTGKLMCADIVDQRVTQTNTQKD